MNMADKLWDLANLVTGFASAQSLAFIFGLVSDNLKLVKGRDAHWAAAIGTSIFTIGYIAAVVWCGYKGQSIANDHTGIWRSVTMGRVFTIVVFDILATGTTYVHWRDQNREQMND